MNKVKEVLYELKKLFADDVEETTVVVDGELDNVELSEEISKTEVVGEQVELAVADEAKSEDVAAEEPVAEEKPEYVTKLELQDFQRKIMEMLEKALSPVESKQDVPQDLSSDEKVELSEDNVEEISHSPEAGVDKKNSFYTPKSQQNESIQSRIYQKLFS